MFKKSKSSTTVSTVLL